MRINRVLVANRGEIAVRIVRTLRDLGRESVAIYADVDQESLHRSMADFSVRLSGQGVAQTYLNIEQIVAIAQSSGADAVHPGYGFLAESVAFCRAVEEAGLVFIGPSAVAMQCLGDKIAARKLMIEHQVAVVPGGVKPLENVAELAACIEDIGLPVILKASGGGGGRGMRVVRRLEDMALSFEQCQREALQCFGNDAIFCERYIESPRHIEFQVLCDVYGNGVHLFERDCSIQRRHQKLFEEAPSVYLSSQQRNTLGAEAVRAVLAAGYCGLGTVEFICESPDQAYFMEVNTRIQVEHPVTECITGIDLVAEQIRVAEGKALAWKQDEIRLHGWSMEARINAEDPAQQFLPTPGRVQRWSVPLGPHVRLDSHVYEGYTIPDAYDSMIAKLIVWGNTREEAIARLKRALAELKVEGIPTTALFHSALLNCPKFVAGDFDTSYMQAEWEWAATAARLAPHADEIAEISLVGMLGEMG
ncbi:MAG: acetyl-CoA carboxylase biotin carboxylase subunit [Zetaproteobacteria bacterium]|nr:acetyl-CoA carboxylase biotin carboxylase subunit [Zetaproteobacteria bacterium]